MLLELVALWLEGLEPGFFPLTLKILFSPFVKGTTAILANQGVAETLTINLIGINALVIAYAVANLQHPISLCALPNLQLKVQCLTVHVKKRRGTYSTTILTPPSPLPHHLCLLAYSSSPSHPFLRK